MTNRTFLLLLGLTSGGLFPAIPEDSDVVFHSDVSLVRVDVQVRGRDNRSITSLNAEDFVLYEQGRQQQILNFAGEDMPVDLLFLFDVSGSMQPHVKRIASAAHQALQVLGDNDRVAIMVFDRTMRLRLPFRNSRPEIDAELENTTRQESFHGGTDITRALVVAASYVEVQARSAARRAIVILTDDQTDFGREDASVSRALEKADAVLSALIVPDEMANPTYSRASWLRRGGGLDLTILGTQSAGTSEIARRSGGDSLPTDDASALETTLERIRQLYALHFKMLPDVKAGEQRNIKVALADSTRRHYPDAEVRYRHVYFAPSGGGTGTTAQAAATTGGDPAQPTVDTERPIQRRRRGVSSNGPWTGPLNGAADPDDQQAAAPTPQRSSRQQPGPIEPPCGGWHRVDEPAPPPCPSDFPANQQPPKPAASQRQPKRN